MENEKWTDLITFELKDYLQSQVLKSWVQNIPALHNIELLPDIEAQHR